MLFSFLGTHTNFCQCKDCSCASCNDFVIIETIPDNLFICYRFIDRRPLINDDLPGRILQGALVIKPNLKELKDTSAVFEDGSQEENISAVIFCTGYKGTFPFLDTALSERPHGELTLYKYVHNFSLTRNWTLWMIPDLLLASSMASTITFILKLQTLFCHSEEYFHHPWNTPLWPSWVFFKLKDQSSQ